MKDHSLIKQVLKNFPEPQYEFQRLLKILLRHEGERKGFQFEEGVKFRDHGIDGIVRSNFPGMESPVGFLFLWLKTKLNRGNAAKDIKKSLKQLKESEVSLKSLVLMTPDELVAAEKQWFEDQARQIPGDFRIYYYDNRHVEKLLKGFPAMKRFFGDIPGFTKIDTRYKECVKRGLQHLQFIGLNTGSYHKQQLLDPPELEEVFIPLDFLDNKKEYEAPFALDKIISQQNRVVLLGDPGSGKTTLASYLALNQMDGLERKNSTPHLIDCKTPLIIPIRRYGAKYGDQKKIQKDEKSPFDFIDYLVDIAQSEYNLKEIGRDYFLALLELGKAILIFDGLDEVASENHRIDIAREIEDFSHRYKDISVWVTSRIVGYTGAVQLDTRSFREYKLAPVSERQASKFIEQWYLSQVTKDKKFRKDRIKSLQQAIIENDGVKRLSSNPLLLTMMTLVHQFEGTLPDNRTKLYEKCIELLLKTWQDQKYSAHGTQNPLEERGLKYDAQVRMLAATAFYIHDKYRSGRANGNKEMIEENSLRKVLLDNRFDSRRMKEDVAREDVRVFLDYIRDRAGLLVERGRNKRGRNLFAFVHLSFLEYLCAYQMAEDKSKSQKEHIQQLLKYLHKPVWTEPILLALHIFDRSTGPSFLDAFAEAAFKKLKSKRYKNKTDGWILLGRAVRDNIKFAPDDIKIICNEVLNTWLQDSENYSAHTILQEISRLTGEKKTLIREVLSENLKHPSALNAVKAYSLYNEFFGLDFDLPAATILLEHKHLKNVYPYLPIYRKFPQIESFINKNLDIEDWFTYFHSASDKTLEVLNRFLETKCSTLELRGYVLSSWHFILNDFKYRQAILKPALRRLPPDSSPDTLRCHFAGLAWVKQPLTLFKPIFDRSVTMNAVPTIDDKRFFSEDRRQSGKPSGAFVDGVVNKIVAETIKTLAGHSSLFTKITGERKELLKGPLNRQGKILLYKFIDEFSHQLIKDYIRELMKGLSDSLSKHFIDALPRYLTGDFLPGLLGDLNRRFIWQLGADLFLEFSRKISSLVDQSYLKSFLLGFIPGNLSNFKNMRERLNRIHLEVFHREMDPENQYEDEIEKIFDLYLKHFQKGESEFIDAFFTDFFEYLLYHQFEVHLETCNIESTQSKPINHSKVMDISNLINVDNTLTIPFTFVFLLAGKLNHHLLNILVGLYNRFHDKEKLDAGMIIDAVDEHGRNCPFLHYIIQFFWEYYSRTFYEKYLQQTDDKTESHLELSSLIASAAKISLTTGIPCTGDYWREILEEAEKLSDNNLFIKISLVFYKICTFQKSKTNSKLLKRLLDDFKRDNPEHYALMGSPTFS